MQTVPHNIEAEAALLGAMMLTPDALHTGLSRLEAHRFYHPTHQTIFAALATLSDAGTSIDVVTLTAQLQSEGNDKVGTAQLMSMSAGTPAATNAEHYVDIVEDLALRRDLLVAAHELSAHVAGDTSSEDLVAEHQRRLLDIASGNSTDTLRLLGDSAQEALDAFDARAANGGELAGMSTGFTDLDELTGGLSPASLTVIGARPSMGKTSLALDIARHQAINLGNPVAFFSLEMNALELNNRLFSVLSRVDSSDIRAGRSTPQERQKLAQAVQTIENAPLWIEETGHITISSIRARSRQARARAGGELAAVVVDYLQLMQGRTDADNRQVQIAEISRGLKILARELDCPVIALSQLSRNLEQRSDKRPMLADLRESGAIEQDADNVMFLYRDEVYNDDSADRGMAEVILAKHRNGPTGTVKLAWLPHLTSFANLARGV